MRSETLRKKYPEVWNRVHAEVLFDFEIGPFKSERLTANKVARERIAYNAASAACHALHIHLKKAGK